MLTIQTVIAMRAVYDTLCEIADAKGYDQVWVRKHPLMRAFAKRLYFITEVN